eukprot:gene10640-3263_t
MKLLLLTTLFVFLSTIQTQDAICNYHGVNIPGYGCSCYSRYFGSNCFNVTSPQNCTIHTPSKLKVDYYPTLVPVTGLGISSHLTIKIQMPIVNNRYESQVSIQNSPNKYCNFPGSTSSQEHISTSPCYNVVRFYMGWDAYAYNCSWDVTKTDTEEFHKGIVYVNQRETAGTVGGVPIERTVKTAIPVQIKFVNQITISGNINYQTNAIVDAAITKLEYIKGPPTSGIIEFITSTDYPHLINSTIPMNITSTNTGLNFTILELTNPQNCPINGFCNQKFRVVMNIKNDTTCSFTGTHKVYFQFGCHVSASCFESASSSLELDINSEDFCSTTNVNVGLSAFMNSYKDSDHIFPSTTFSTDTVVFLKLQTFANVQIVSKTLQRFQWTSNTTRVLFDNGNTTSDGIVENFQGNATKIQFRLIHSHLNNVAHGSQIVLSANVLIAYKATPNGDVMKSMETVEMLFATGEDGFQETKTSTKISLELTANSGAKHSFVILTMIFCFLCILF